MLTALLIYVISALSIYNVASFSQCGYNYAFVVDESGSVASDDYEASIDFVIDLIQNHIADTAQLTAHNQDWIYHFSDPQLPRAKLQPGDQDRIIDELILEKTSIPMGPTQTKQAVQAAIAEFQTNSYTQNNILILVTDGGGNDPCVTSVINDLNNIRVIIVGVGGFNPSAVDCLVRGQISDIIDIDAITNFDFAPVITQLQQEQIVCGSSEYDCISSNADCTGRADGDYHSCISCNVYASCWGEGTQITDNRPCALTHDGTGRLEYDANLGWCVWPGESTTCNGYTNAKSFYNDIDLGDNLNDNVKNNNNNNYYYGYIMLIGVIAFILINNIFIGCWCMGKAKKQYENVKFDMVGDDEEI